MAGYSHLAFLEELSRQQNYARRPVPHLHQRSVRLRPILEAHAWQTPRRPVPWRYQPASLSAIAGVQNHWCVDAAWVRSLAHNAQAQLTCCGMNNIEPAGVGTKSLPAFTLVYCRIASTRYYSRNSAAHMFIMVAPSLDIVVLPLSSYISLSMPLGPSVDWTMSTTAKQAPMLLSLQAQTSPPEVSQVRHRTRPRRRAHIWPFP
eukprot:COSAG02_NODE_499_length_21072_cov_6.490011_6_plen_204_part_00